MATGARWRNINVPGEKEYRNKGVAYCPHCDGPLVQGQARRGDRRRQLRRRSGDRPGGHRGARDADRVRHTAARRRGAAAQARDACRTSTVLLNAQTTEVTGDGQKVNGLVYKDRASARIQARRTRRRLRADRPGAQHRMAQGHASSCRGTARSSSMRRARPRCRACSPPATRPRCRSSRSSSPPATAPRPRSARSITSMRN